MHVNFILICKYFELNLCASNRNFILIFKMLYCNLNYHFLFFCCYSNVRWVGINFNVVISFLLKFIRWLTSFKILYFLNYFGFYVLIHITRQMSHGSKIYIGSIYFFKNVQITSLFNILPYGFHLFLLSSTLMYYFAKSSIKLNNEMIFFQPQHQIIKI